MLSESTALKYFGDEDPIGQSLEVRGWIDGRYLVNGIFSDVPANSHLQINILLPLIDLLTRSDFSKPSTSWGWTNFITYVQLAALADPGAVEEKMTSVLMKHREDDFKSSNISAHVTLQPLMDIHLNEELSVEKTTMGSYRAVYFFTIIGMITLLIALFNYINLSTARALDRAHEVGVRKVTGARKNQLIFQFLSESTLLVFIAFVLAFVMANSLKGWISSLAGLNMTTSLWRSPEFWIFVLTAFVSTALLAGLYPAWVLSSFKPAAVLKGKMTKSTGAWFRTGLVVLQFSASIILLIGTGIVFKQLRFMQRMDLGIDLEQILTIQGPRVLRDDMEQSEVNNTFFSELSRIPAVLQTASSYSAPGQDYAASTNSIQKWSDDPSRNISGYVTWIDENFDSLYGLELAAGYGFKHLSESIKNDTLWPVIVNETAAQTLGFGSAQEALHEKLWIFGNPSRIVGVFKDFNWSSAHKKIEPAFYRFRSGQCISVKVRADNLPQTLAQIETKYKELFPGNPFQYAFADETFDAQYRSDRRFARLFSVFAFLAMFIACLGLFGLATFTAQKRTKEIGIRKVLGATVDQIVFLLSRDFTMLVLIAFIISIPIAWYIMQQWLQDFAYRIDIEWWMFAIAGILAFVIANITIGFQSVRSALMNPAESLKEE
jgi:putative ABC transport system permease protein